MATKNEDSIFDTEDMPSTELKDSPRITEAGLHHNLKVAVEYKEDAYKDQEKNPGNWAAFSVTVTDPNGFSFQELYFRPPQSEADVKPDRLYPLKKYQVVEGKTVEVGICNQVEEMKRLNNEFLAYLLDLGEAMGFPHADVKAYLFSKATDFKSLCQAFIDKFRPTDNTRISAKILYNNSKKKEISQLRIHGNFPVYYPYGNDLFDMWKEGRPTVLQLSNYEINNNIKKLYTGTSDKPKGDDVVSKRIDVSDTPDDDPF